MPYTYTILHNPNTSEFDLFFLSGINDSGLIVGFDSTGYVAYNGSTYTPLIVDVPGHVNGINDSGQMVGSFSDAMGTHGFIYNGSTYTTLDDPNATPGNTYAYGINDSGQVAGYFRDTTGTHGFIYNGSTYTTLDDPNATPGNTYAYGINDSGQVAGSFNILDILDDPVLRRSYGFVYNGSTYTTLTHPETVPYGATYAYSINDSGQVAGSFVTTFFSGPYGFVYNGSTYTTIDPGAVRGTGITGINDSGQVIGDYVGFCDVGLCQQAFLAAPVSAISEPATFVMFSLGLAGMSFIRCRRVV